VPSQRQVVGRSKGGINIREVNGISVSVWGAEEGTAIVSKVKFECGISIDRKDLSESYCLIALC